jgi:short-subunit dehydrogenase
MTTDRIAARGAFADIDWMRALTVSLVHEVADKGVRVQAVLPGATATEFWETVGVPVDQLPTGTV